MHRGTGTRTGGIGMAETLRLCVKSADVVCSDWSRLAVQYPIHGAICGGIPNALFPGIYTVSS
jgi:hypothetical protein